MNVLRLLRSGVGALCILGLFCHALRAAGGAPQLNVDWLTHPAIQYAVRPTHDPMADLKRQVEEGEVQLTFDGPSGYLRALLEALHVPIESQVVVFLKDSVQSARINAHNPRTIFFNDSVVVGWVRGGFIEIASEDPDSAMIFYTLVQTPSDKPVFTRRVDCLSCHRSYATSGVAGTLIRGAGRYIIEQSVPLEQRWGGWYVTGTLGSIRHAGNVDVDRLFESPPPTNTLNLQSLDGKFDTTGYLSPYSDIAALLVFDHQMRMMNLLSRIGWEVRIAEYDGGDAAAVARETANEVVDYMLFVGEAPLSDTVEGSSGFAEKFAAQGPRDQKGRSLRQLDLKQRLMRYPCSYMIYTPTFEGLPAEAKDAIYRRMWEVLSGHEKDARYDRMSADDRRAIVEILRDTKKDLPPYFQ